MPKIQLEKTKSGKVIGGDGKPLLGGFKRGQRVEPGEYIVKLTQLGAKTTKDSGPMLLIEGKLVESIPDVEIDALAVGKSIGHSVFGFDYEKVAAQVCFAIDGLSWEEGTEQTEDEINAQLSTYVVDLDVKNPPVSPAAGKLIAITAWHGKPPTNEDGTPKLGKDKKPMQPFVKIAVLPAPEADADAAQ